MRVIIIGGSSIIGKEVYTTFANRGVSTIATYCNNYLNNMIKFDINSQALSEVIKDLNNDDKIIILSSITDVNWIFKNQKKSYEFNTYKIIKLINDIAAIGCEIIYMSSAEVFDGRVGNYDENCEPNPVNYYGKTKADVEKYLVSNIKNYKIVRTGWNVTDNIVSRCPINQTMEALLKDNCKMATDNWFTITHAKDLADGMYALALANTKDTVFHLCSNEKISRVMLADLVIKFSNQKNKMSYKKVKFSDINYLEPRARLNDLSSLYTNKLLKLRYRTIEQLVRKKIAIIEKKII